MAAIYQWFKTRFIQGLCVTSDDVAIADVMTPMAMPRNNFRVVYDSPENDGYETQNTKIISFTTVFVRTAAPDPGYNVNLFSIARNASKYRLRISMNSDGHIQVQAYNSAHVRILNVLIAGKNGASLADSVVHTLAFVIDLRSTSSREVFLDGRDITDVNTGQISWDTYTDDFINIKSEAGSTMRYSFGVMGIGFYQGVKWNEEGSPWNGQNGLDPSWPTWNGLGDSLAFMSFDDACTLLSAGACVRGGYVADPGEWEGWYTTQPMFFYGPSVWKNTGRFEPANFAAEAGNVSQGGQSRWKGALSDYDWTQPSRVINYNLTETTDFWDWLLLNPDAKDAAYIPGVDPRVLLAANHWDNLPQDGLIDISGGNWLDLTTHTEATFESVFGDSFDNVAAAAFDGAVAATNTKIPISTTQLHTRLRLTGGSSFLIPPNRWTNFTDGSMVLTNSDGDIVNFCLSRDGGDVTWKYIEVPNTGDTYYLVMNSDTSLLRVQAYRAWD